MTFTKEWLQHQISAIEAVGITDSNTLEAFKLALAGMEAEPVGVTDKSEIECLKRGKMANVMPPDYKGCDSGDSVYLYDAPQPLTTSERAELENYRNAQVVRSITKYFDDIALETAREIMCDVNRRHEFLGGEVQLLSRIQCRVDDACRAAMLQGGNHTEQHLDMVNSPVIPDGWVMVPAEPTMAMLDEFDSIIDYGAEDSKDAWGRLIAAAPKQEAE